MLKPIIILSLSLVVFWGSFFSSGQSQQIQSSSTPDVMEDSAVAAIYKSYCAGCHGSTTEAFADRVWKFGKTKEKLYITISEGYENEGMPAFKAGLKENEINALADYILKSIVNVDSTVCKKRL